MKISDLLAILPNKKVIRPVHDDMEIAGIAHDSRKVKPGDLFVAIPGQLVDGHDYVPQAIANGAVVILGEERGQKDSIPVPYVVVPDTRAGLAIAAAAYYKFPAHKVRVIGVTGTDGKTTTATLVQATLSAAGFRADSITTIGALIGNTPLELGVHVTTPDALDMQRYLAEMVARGADYAVLETTSHGLAQSRVRHCAFDVAVITNITHEHLDYHRTYEAYREAKASLFRALLEESHRKANTPKVSILNRDDTSFEYLSNIKADIQLTYGLAHPAEFGAKNIHYATQGTKFTVMTPTGNLDVEMALVGKHNVYNALAAIAVARSQGVAFEAIREGIGRVERVVGRMQRIDYGQDFDLFLDYAHTPNAIGAVLQGARNLTRGKLIVVCGLSGGLRDKTKRPIMGEVVGRLADRIVITSMDWYDEDVEEIIRQIALGCERANRQERVDYWCFRDRKAGIVFGIGMAQPGDIVIIAGKAHERSISYGGVEHPWDEFETVKEALEEKLRSAL